MLLLPETTTLAILASHKVGHVVPCVGLARALGVAPQMRRVHPRGIFRLLAPWGPPDPRDASGTPDDPLGKPFPDIAVASGRETVPYLRAIKKRSRGRCFTVFLGDPRTSHDVFDVIALPEHDRWRGRNVVTYLTAPHPYSEQAREAARAHPHPAIASLPGPRVALLVGGPSSTYHFEAVDSETLVIAARTALNWHASLMISTSRRTPKRLIQALRAEIAADEPARAKRTFIWDGQGDNPYPSILAMADFFIVTADSTNMIGEAVATGKPVYVFEPSGGPGKSARLISELKRRGAVRDWLRRLESWQYEPVDSTSFVAEEIAARYATFVKKR